MKSPSANIHGSGAPVIEFQVLVVGATRDRLEHDLVNCHDADLGFLVLQSKSLCLERIEFLPSIWVASQGNAIRLWPILHRVQDASRRCTLEIDGLAGRTQTKPKFRRVKRDPTT